MAGMMKNPWRLLTAVCVLVIGVYAYMTQPSAWELLIPNAADTHYNLLVEGLRAGQLSLRKEVPPELAQLADPYDPAANALYRSEPRGLHDLSYYKGKLYLYFGITPALILFWPFAALTGQYLFHRQAVTIFCAIGFLTSVGLLRALWRRYFAEVNVWVVAACALALGLATGVPVLMSRCDVYEVAISCGYMLTMLALGAIWRALHEPRRRSGWLAAASVAYGLAVGARPSLSLGAVILLVPVALAWRERRQVWALLMAALGPILLIGLALMLYNFLRFDSPFEFGTHYQLCGRPQLAEQLFRLRYFWFNLRVYFLEPARWSAHFPFVRGIAVPPMPTGFYSAAEAFGVLTNLPVVWLALAAPLAWRRRSAEAGAMLRAFVMAAALLFGICALTVGLFWAAAIRYEVDFLPALLLLAVVGILGLERVLAPTSESGQAPISESRQTGRSIWRRVARWGWVLLLSFSVAFNLLASVQRCAGAHYTVGTILLQLGRVQEAVEQDEQAVRLMPDFAEAHNNLGNALLQAGNVAEAIKHYHEALRLMPDSALVHYNLANALSQAGQTEEAIGHYEQALWIRPEYAEAHYNLGNALLQAGRVSEAIGHYEQALQIKPEYAEAHNNLGYALLQAGKGGEAIKHLHEALRLQPNIAETHYILGNALLQLGRGQEAAEQYQQALQIKPDFTEAQDALARLQPRQ
jgi:tetratricopeptide (TPR) repeat protein